MSLNNRVQGRAVNSKLCVVVGSAKHRTLSAVASGAAPSAPRPPGSLSGSDQECRELKTLLTVSVGNLAKVRVRRSIHLLKFSKKIQEVRTKVAGAAALIFNTWTTREPLPRR
jgi:hypothetical protein